MKPRLCGLGLWDVLTILLLYASGGSAEVLQPQEVAVARRSDDFVYSAEKRTFLFGKLVLVPVLAAIGLKFLALLPIVLTKIVLLSIMNFLSTNLNLLVSTLFGLKNFLGKHGLWAQEYNTTRHPDIETFAEYANHPLLQPSFRYQYAVDNEPMLGRIEPPTKAPFVKVFNSFVPTETGSYKVMFDRRTRENDRRHVVRAKEQRSVDSERGKYKCYWTSAGEDLRTKFGVGKQEEVIRKRKFDVVDNRRVKSNRYGQELNTYREPAPNKIAQPRDVYASLPNFYDYRSFVNSNSISNNNNNNNNNNDNESKDSGADYYRQVATQVSAAASGDDGSGILPFTASGGQVKVDENYGMRVQRQRPLVYLMQEAEAEATTTPVKFKDGGDGN